MAKDELEIKFDTRWEWCSNPTTNEWSLFDSTTQKILNDALENKFNSVEFNINDNKFEAKLDHKLVQINLKTKYERPIRMCIRLIQNENEEDKNSDWFCWQWLNELNNWITYSPSIQIDLEKHFHLYKTGDGKKSTLKIIITNTSYLIDFVKMKQKNEKSGFGRDVQRVASDVTNMNDNDASNNSGPASNLRKRNLVKSGSAISLSTQDRPKRTRKDNKENNTIAENETDENKEEKQEIKPSFKKTRSTKSAVNIKMEIEDESLDTSTAATSSKRKLKEENDDDKDKITKNVSNAKKSKSSSKIVKKEIEDDEIKHESASEPKEEEQEIKIVKYTGDIPLDPVFTELIGFDYKVYKEENDIYDVMLNQTNLQNNNNKYYLIQLVENVKNKNYIVWMRWGRVGKQGQNSAEKCGTNLLQAKNIFCKKFSDKTYNNWDERHSFVKHPGKYDLVHKDYDDFKTEEEKLDIKKESNENVDIPASILDKPVQQLIELICNVNEMEALLKEMKYDAKKSPLGKLSKTQIKAGYSSLKLIEELVRNKNSGRELVDANNEFYTRIPHDFGMRKPPLISTLPQVREKIRLLEVLDDIEVAVKAMNQKSEIVNPIDRHYDQLECKLKAISNDHKMFKIIEEYAKKTHAPTHNNYKLKILEIFEAEKEGNFTDVGNRMLLWHGSRLTNWAGILSSGLKIAPPEAPVTGYMFGKGCYFADCCSKSANYCYTSSTKNTGILSLCEVSLGNFNELKQADYDADKLPKNKHSTKGLGKSEPDKKEWVTLDDGCVVPVGKMKQCVDKNDAHNYSLLYNEYVVYNVDQVRLRYLVKVKFDYDNLDSDEE